MIPSFLVIIKSHLLIFREKFDHLPVYGEDKAAINFADYFKKIEVST